jgi:2,3-bisphosphoglycerate-independent phosphoglycerate mutase
MRKLLPEERLKHGVIVLLKKEDYEDLKRFAEAQETSQAAWTRKLVLQGLQRARKLEKIEKESAEARQNTKALEKAPKRESIQPRAKSKSKK